MDRRRRLSTSSGLGIFLILMAAAVAAGPIHAQAPLEAFTDPSTGKVFTRKKLFRLPIKIDEKTRAATREVVLFVKQLPGPWVKQEVAQPTQGMFSYQAPGDGEYWFTVGTVDRNGRSTPADINQEPPALMVVVDTRPPVIEVQPQPLPGGELTLRCALRDGCPDYANVKLSYRGADGNWQPLNPHPVQPGCFQIPSPDVLQRMVRCTATDRLGQSTTQDFDLRGGVALTGGTIPDAPAVPGVPQLPASSFPLSSNPGGPPAQLTPPPAPAANQMAQLPQPMPTGSAVPLLPAAPPPPSSAPALPAPLPSALSGSGGVENIVQKPAPSPALVPTDSGQRHLLSNTRARLEYRIEPVGPSGISRVDVWLTADQGRTWQRLCSDTDQQSPVEINLPGEGQFGLRLVVTNGNGFGGTPPRAGALPTYTVEVDTTPPVAQIRGVEPTSTPGLLEIRWTAGDKNLGTDAVNLLYSTRREGPWQPIARNIQNDGLYRWQFPREIGGQFFVRLEVADQAGHVTRSDTPQAISLDMTEPQAQVLGVTALTTRPLTPVGH